MYASRALPHPPSLLLRQGRAGGAGIMSVCVIYESVRLAGFSLGLRRVG